MLLSCAERSVGGTAVPHHPSASGGAVRTQEPRLRRLIQQGLARSPTLQSLITELNGSDVIVYIQWLNSTTRSYFGGYLMDRVVTAGGYRYLTVAVTPSLGDERLIAVIAHELQHAREVARSPDVGRAITVQQLFERGETVLCGGGNCFETRDALRIQEAVMRELRRN
jgi:hypothetical protein